MDNYLEIQLANVKHGDHVCPICESTREQMSVAAPFVQQGLIRGEKCICVADSPLKEELKEAFTSNGISIEREQERGALRFLTKQDVYYRSGEFQPQSMIDFLHEAEVGALAEGFSGVRFMGEMSWVAVDKIKTNLLLQYEASLNQFVTGRKSTILCLYNRKQFDGAIIHDVLRSHPTTIVDDRLLANPYYESPEFALSHETVASDEFKRKRVDWCILRLKDVIAAEKERERVVAALKESEAHVRLLLNSTAEGIFGLDVKGYCTFANPACARLLHCPDPEQLVGKNMHALTHHTRRDGTPLPQHECLINKASECGAKTHEDEEVFWRLDGTKFDAEYFSFPIQRDGKNIGAVVTFLDISDRKQAEAELHLQIRAIQAVTQGILITDPNQSDNPVIYANDGFQKITGYTSAEAKGRNCRFLQGKDTDPKTIEVIRRAIKERRPCTVEILNYRKDGTRFWNELFIAPVAGADGNLTHFVGVQSDVTQRRRLEEQLRQSQKMEAIGQMAGGIAHDFNNLLTIITGYSELLLETAPMGDASREPLEAIKHAGERSAALTRQLLAFGRKQVLAPKVIDLNEVLHDTEKMLHRIIGEDIELTTTLCPKLDKVLADPGQIEQVLINLVVNARDSMPKGGKITIETQNVNFDADYARTHVGVRSGRCAMLAVTDSGVGMNEEVRSRVFEPFFTTKGPNEGTGLGLSVVHGIVKQSDGDIVVYSEPGLGTSFKIYLPHTEYSGHAIETQSTYGPTLAQGNETILLIEDEEGVRTLARKVLTGCGYNVFDANGGAEAFKICSEGSETIHLLITDVVMPNEGGREISERLQAIYPQMKVLYISGYTDDAVVRHGILHEHVNFLQKPFSPSALANRVREVLMQ